MAMPRIALSPTRPRFADASRYKGPQRAEVRQAHFFNGEAPQQA